MEQPSPNDRHASSKGRAIGQFLTVRVPAWVALLLVLVVAGPLGWLLLGERMDTVELGPVVSNAESIDIELRLCNRDVDAHDINPRQAELHLQETFEDEGADQASVRVRRRDCPAPRAGARD